MIWGLMNYEKWFAPVMNQVCIKCKGSGIIMRKGVKKVCYKCNGKGKR